MSLSLAAHAPPLRQDHGALRVGRSNVTLESVLWAFKQGATPEQIIDQFPTITLADAYEVVGYYLRNRAQVDVYAALQPRAIMRQRPDGCKRLLGRLHRYRPTTRARNSKTGFRCGGE